METKHISQRHLCLFTPSLSHAGTACVFKACLSPAILVMLLCLTSVTPVGLPPLSPSGWSHTVVLTLMFATKKEIQAPPRELPILRPARVMPRARAFLYELIISSFILVIRLISGRCQARHITTHRLRNLGSFKALDIAV